LSIVDVRVTPPPRPSSRRFLLVVAIASLLAGAAAAWFYSAGALTLSHYDAKAHLVVARRIFDSLTPGWRQIGAVWLPLPHLLNALPVQIDAFYRDGTSGVAISILSFAVATTSLAWLVVRATGSAAAATASSVVFASNPNVLYLQSTPMTEPLLLAGLLLGTALLYRRLGVHRDGGSIAALGWVLAAACLTRYEAWPFTMAMLGLTLVVPLLQGQRASTAFRSTIVLAAYPAVAVVSFLVLSRATVGEWFVTGGFYVPDNKAYGRPLVAIAAVWWGLCRVAGTVTTLAGTAGALALTAKALQLRQRAPTLVALGLAATAALPWYAFLSGHPFRIRYMIVLVAGVAACIGLGVGLLPRALRLTGAVLVAVVALLNTPPLSGKAPMVLEAQWDRPNSIGRREVTRCLAGRFVRPRDKILASMGSLAHYMQELSHAGFALDDFVHEGIGELWPEALASPRRHVRWVLFEERAEGGDMLTALRKDRPSFLDGFTRVCEGGGVALYERDDEKVSGARVRGAR
jgi:hypothetical protein